jgi:hypothetical protein
MNKTWKWILGVVLVLALIAGMFAVGYFWRSHSYGMMGGYGDFGPQANSRNWQHPMMDGHNGYGPTMHSRGDPMMGGYSPFMGGLFFLGGLLRFAVFAGLLYGAYWLGKRNARIALDPQPAAAVSAPPAPPSDSDAA